MEETQEKIQKIFEIYGKQIFGVVILALAGFGAYGIYSSYKSSIEYKAQEAFGKIEREYNEKRQDFAQAKSQNPKSTESQTEKTPQPATGDLTKDYGSFVEGFQSILTMHPGTQAAKMSALYLSEVYTDYRMMTEALNALENQGPAKQDDLISILIAHRKAALIADQGKCADARSQWETLTTLSPDFLRDEIKMRIALCHEQEGQLELARQMYQELSQKPAENGTPISRDAEKYLRYLNFRNPSAPVGKAMDQ